MEYILLWVMGIWIALMFPLFGAFALIALTDPRWPKYGRRMRKQIIYNCMGAAICWPWFVPWVLFDFYVLKHK